MKVLVVARGYPQPHNNMLGMFELDQAIALKNAGHQVAYAAVDIRSIRRKRKLGYNHFTDPNGIEVFEMNWPVGGIQQDVANYLCSMCFAKLYPNIQKEFGTPDIIHAHFLKIGTAAMSVCRKNNIPLILTEHSSYLNKTGLSKSVYRRAVTTYNSCSALISVSHPLAENIKSVTGFDSIVIHNIANVGEGKRVLKKPDNKTTLFVAAGNLLPRKGFDTLLRAFVRAHETYEDIRLDIYGEGVERSNLEELITELSLDSCVSLKGRYNKKDLDVLFENAVAFVLASRAETFGVVYIEAMSLGLPVIATRCGGPEDFVKDNNGYLVEVDNIDQLADAIIQMKENWRYFDRDEIAHYAHAHFSSEMIAGQITDVYHRVLDGKGLIGNAK